MVPAIPADFGLTKLLKGSLATNLIVTRTRSELIVRIFYEAPSEGKLECSRVQVPKTQHQVLVMDTGILWTLGSVSGQGRAGLAPRVSLVKYLSLKQYS